MAFKFPFTNYHELNLTWVLDQLKALFEKSEENVTTIETYEGRLSTVEAEIPVISETASEASRAAAASGTLAQTAKATADTAQENAIQAQTAAGTARQEAQAAQTAANEATQAAQQAQATAQNFDGRITQAENDASQALEASRSFENRVQSAITTANNANQTATNAQGIAMRADQNAGAALDKIGDLSDLTTTAKQNLVAAINEAAQTGGGGGGAVSSVNGKTGAVVLDAGDIGYNNTTVEAALNGKQNAPSVSGNAGQVLGLNNSLQPVWVDQTGGSGDNSNCAPIIINTASGAIASFSDGLLNRQILKIVGTIEPQQSGTGKPSPDNVRPISGWTGANIYSEEMYDASATPKLTINWETEAGTVYGGTVTLNEDGSADVLVDREIADMGTLNFVSGQNYKSGNFFCKLSNRYKTRADGSHLVCEVYSSAGTQSAYYTGADLSVWYYSDLGFNRLFLRNTNYYINGASDVTGLNESISGKLIVLDLRTPITYHFDNIGQLYTYLGDNNVWIDTGSITECVYPADTKRYIDNKIAELQALILEH